MPPGLMNPDISVSPYLWRPGGNDQLQLKLPGLQYCADCGPELQLLYRLTRYFADREQDFQMPSLSEPTPLLVTSEEASHDLGLSQDEITKAWELLGCFEWRVCSMNGGPERWTANIESEEIRRYRRVDTVPQYLGARADLDRPPTRPVHPRLPTVEAQEMADAVAAPMRPRSSSAPPVPDSSPPVAPSVEAAPAHERDRSRVLGRVTSNPTVAAIVATVVGGLILAILVTAFGLR